MRIIGVSAFIDNEARNAFFIKLMKNDQPYYIRRAPRIQTDMARTR